MTKEELESLFLTAEKLYKEIDELVWMEDITYLEATMKICEEKQIDVEDIKKLKLVSPILYSKLHSEATSLGQLKPSATLPV